MGLYHTQVAMLCLAGMKEDGRDSRRGEGGGNIVGNLATLAHARGDEFAPLVLHLLDYQIDGLLVGVGHGYVKDGLALGLQYLLH